MKAKTVEDIRATLKEGRATIGSWMQLPNDGVAEIMGAGGFDWVALDLEHGRFAEDQLASLFRAIAMGGALPCARIGQVSAYAVKAVMDSGAEGVVLPMIETAELLRDAIGWANFPPRGTRGVGYSRANLFGKNFDPYRERINPLVVAQIEHIRAIENIDAIMTVPGLDAIMVGPYDLSASMGLTGQFDHPDFAAALVRLSEASRRHGVPSGLHVVQPEPARVEAAIREGHQFIAYGVDAVFLWHGARRPNS